MIIERHDFIDKPWIEKYRPSTLEEVVGNLEIISYLKIIGLQGNLPNIILTGPPGTGKTTSILAIAKQLLGEQFKIATLELNASDERGIDTVRDRIKSFAAQKVNLPEGRHKIIILDEADSMTESAQQALRVIISDSSSTTRFVLACNDSSKIIEAIQSRCNIFRFSRLNYEDIRQNILRIIRLENVKYNEEGINSLIETSDGDMRYAVNNMQSCVIGFGELNKVNIYKIVDIPRPEVMLRLFEQCMNLDYSVLNNIEELMTEGYNSIEIIGVLTRIVEATNLIEDELRDKILKIISQSKKLILDSYDSKIQLFSMFSKIVAIFNLKK